MHVDPALFSSMGSFLQYLLPHFRALSLPVFDQQNLEKLGQHLPLVSLGCFELELDHPASKLDMAVNLVRAAGEWDAFLHHSAKLSGGIPSPLQGFMHGCMLPSSALNQYVPNIWLNLDNHILPGALPSTWFYVGLPPHPFGVELEKELALQVMKLISPALFAKNQGYLEHIMSLFAKGQRLRGVASLERRGLSQFRLIVSHFPEPSGLATFLKKLGWPGDYPYLEAVLGPLLPMVDRCDLALDVDQQLGKRIGVELFLPLCTDFGYFEHFTQKIDRFYPLDQGKIKGIKSYFGHKPSPADINWQPSQGMLPGKLPCRQPGMTNRWVMHLKIVFEPGQIVKVKAYLGFTYTRAL